MARRIDIELTSARPDGSWTWRAAGALKPRGILDGKLLSAGAKPGDVLRVDAEFEIEGITIVNVLPPKDKRSEPERLEIIGPPRAAAPAVTTSLTRPPRDTEDGPRRPRRGDREGGPGASGRDSGGGSGGPRGGRDGSDRSDGPRAGRGDRPRIDRGSRPGGPLGGDRGSRPGGPLEGDRGSRPGGVGGRGGRRDGVAAGAGPRPEGGHREEGSRRGGIDEGAAAASTESGSPGDADGITAETAPTKAGAGGGSDTSSGPSHADAGDQGRGADRASRGAAGGGAPQGRAGGSGPGGRSGFGGGAGGPAGPGGAGRDTRGRRPGGMAGEEHRPGGPPRGPRPARPGRPHEGDEPGGGDLARSGASRGGSHRSPAAPGGGDRPKAKRLTPGNAHRQALLESLPPEHRPIAEQVIRGGIPAVRTAIHLEGEKAAAEGRPSPNAQALLAIAEELLPRVKAAEWRDRAEAAAKMADELPLRELRSLLDGASAARDDQSRALAANLRETVDRRGEALLAGWVEEIQTNLAESRVVRALRLSARPPEATNKLPADLAVQLTDAAGQAMSPDTPSERWAAMLEAVAASPVRRQVKPLGLPSDAQEPLLQVARQQSARVPALAPMLGITIPPPPGPIRPPPPSPSPN